MGWWTASGWDFGGGNGWSAKPQQTILVVDKEKNYRIILSGLLEKAGYRVIAVGGEAACFDLLSRERVDLVLADLELNGCGRARFLSPEPRLERGCPLYPVQQLPVAPVPGRDAGNWYH